jgi:hypothetical protein
MRFDDLHFYSLLLASSSSIRQTFNPEIESPAEMPAFLFPRLKHHTAIRSPGKVQPPGFSHHSPQRFLLSRQAAAYPPTKPSRFHLLPALGGIPDLLLVLAPFVPLEQLL